MLRKRHEGHRITPHTQLRGENMSLKTFAGSPRRRVVLVVAARCCPHYLSEAGKYFPHLVVGEQGKQALSQESAREAMDRLWMS